LKKNGLNYLLTTKINQDALKNLFSQLRTRGGLIDHPSPLNTLYRLRIIILGKNPCIVHNNTNTADNTQKKCIIAKTLKSVEIQIDDDNVSEDFKNDINTTDENELQNSKTEMGQHAIEYLAGWMAKKYRLKLPEIGSTTTELMKDNHDHNHVIPSWINHLSCVGLIVPSSDFENIVFRAEYIDSLI